MRWRRTCAGCPRSALQLSVIGVALAGCASFEPIVLAPASVKRMTPCPAPRAAWVVEAVSDSRGYADFANVGFAHTGPSNFRTSLRTSPSPSELVRRSLYASLVDCQKLRLTGAPPLRIQVQLTRFQTTETTSFSADEMRVDIVYDVEVKHGNAVIGRFTVRLVRSIWSSIPGTARKN